jgi:nitroreductase
MHSFFELIKKRVSLRSYDKHRMVQEVDLKMILEAGRLAPSAQTDSLGSSG